MDGTGLRTAVKHSLISQRMESNMQNTKLAINEELRTLIPPLAEDERRLLEENIIRDGCREPLTVWQDTLLDGHNRYDICEEHGIRY